MSAALATSASAVPRWLPWTSLLLSIAGLGDSAYLTFEHYTGSHNLACPANATFNCEKVTTGPWASFHGVPVVLGGLAFFAVMIVLTLPPLWRSARPAVVRLRAAAVVVGMAGVLLLVYRELFEAKAICLWCTGVHALTFVLFVLVVATLPAMVEEARSRRTG